jgi:hypothetical protein
MPLVAGAEHVELVRAGLAADSIAWSTPSAMSADCSWIA